MAMTARQARTAAFYARQGAKFTLDKNGKAYPVVSSIIGQGDYDYLPEGAGNAAHADMRWMDAAFDCPAAIGDTGVWSANGAKYTVIAISPVIMGGETVAWRLAAYRTPDVSETDAQSSQDPTW